MRRPSSMLFAALAALTLLGCPAKPQYPECKEDGDCKDHAQVCIAGFCKECRDDAQCKANQVCKDNGCQAKPECASAKDCAAGQKCSAAGKCTAECDEKTAEQDCGAGRRCLSGRCAAEEECLADADCGSSKACVKGLCRAQGDSDTDAALRAKLACEVKPIFFDFDEATLSKAARDTVDQDWQCLQRSAMKRLDLQGHTDERGTTEYNLALGSRRAEAVRKYLGQLGADGKKVRTVSYGKERPADQAHDETSWAKNRRVELVPEQ